MSSCVAAVQLLALGLGALGLATAETACADEVAISDFEPHDQDRDRTVPLRVYLPENEAPQPVVLFSHGLGGSRENNAYLGEYWTRAGYVAVFLQHPGSDDSIWREARPSERMQALRGGANLQAMLDRFADVSFVIDELERWNAREDHPLGGRLDLDRIGMSGHSFGANTTQGLMGQKFAVPRSFEEPRIGAFIAFSPSVRRRPDPDEAFGGVEAPVLLMTGTLDDSPLDPSTTPESRRLVFSALPEGDKYQLVFEGGNHFAFSDVGLGRDRIAHHHPAIQLVSTRFWDAYLRDDEEARSWLVSDEVREAAGLDAADVWEWK